MNWDLEKFVIFETLAGSTVYGTSISTSDKDFRGICIPPKEIRDNLLINFEQRDSWGEQINLLLKDRVIYSLKKFLTMLEKNNPSIIELLFIPEEFWITHTYEWHKIVMNVDLFLSTKIKHTFSGYAYSQLSRIKRHRGYLLNPPKEEPTRVAYELSPNPKMSQEQLSAVLTIPEDFVIENYREEARREKAYRQSKFNWDDYMAWKKGRNPDRAKLEEKFGYDTKHASHLVRLIYEGRDLLLNGKIKFPLEEAEELLAIKNGLYTYDQLIEKTGDFDLKFEQYEKESKLPHDPNIKKINELYLDLIKDI